MTDPPSSSTLIQQQQSVIHTSISMNSHSSKVHRSSRRRDKLREKHKSRRSRSRDRERRKERKYRDRDRERIKERKSRKKSLKSSHRSSRGGHAYDRKRRRSNSSNRKSAHEERDRKRRKLSSKTMVPLASAHTNGMENDYNLTLDASINNRENMNIKDIKNLVSNKSISNIDHIANIPAVLQDKPFQNNQLQSTASAVKTTTQQQNVSTKTSRKTPPSSSSENASGSESEESNENENANQNTNNEEEEEDDEESNESESGSSSYSDETDSEYSTDSSQSKSSKEVVIVSNKLKSSSSKHSRHHRSRSLKSSSSKSKHRRDRDRNSSRSHRHSRRREKRHRERERDRERDRTQPKSASRGPTPNWIRHQEKEWFKTMEMLTTFNHRKNYRDKFLIVFEHDVYNKYARFWQGKHPQSEDLEALAAMFEQKYFEYFSSIRQVREYQQNININPAAAATATATNSNNNHNNNANGAVPSSSFPITAPQNAQNETIKTVQPNVNITNVNNGNGNELLSMLNLSNNDFNANIQKIQAMLAIHTQQSEQQNTNNMPPKKTRLPRLLQQQQQQQVAKSESLPPPSLPMPHQVIIQNQVPPQQQPMVPQQTITIQPPHQLMQQPPQSHQMPQQQVIVPNEELIPKLDENQMKKEQELPTPEPIVLQKNEVEQKQNVLIETDEQICEKLKIPSPPRDPRLSKEPTPNMEIINEEEEEDENMSVISDVVTEDDIIMISSPMNGSMQQKEDNESTQSMSPEVNIEDKKLTNSTKLSQNLDLEKEENDDIESGLNALLGFFGDDNNDKKSMDIDVETIENNTPQIEVNEMKTNSTANTNSNENGANIGIDSSWLFSDDEDISNKLPGMNVPNMQQPKNAPFVIENTAQKSNNMQATTHFIPEPSYYNPPSPGKDIDRRKQSIQPIPRRRAVRRRKTAQPTMTNMIPQNNGQNGNGVGVGVEDVNNNKVRPRAVKKRGFFNRIRKQSVSNLDRDKMIKSRINKTMNHNHLIPKSGVNAGMNNRMNKIRKSLIPKTRESQTKSIDTIRNQSAKMLQQRIKLKAAQQQKSKSITPNPLIPSSAQQNKAKSKSKSITPSVSSSSLSHIKRPNNAKSTIMPITNRAPIRRPLQRPTQLKTNRTVNKNISAATSKERHYIELGPKLDAPPTDLSALFDDGNGNKKNNQNDTKIAKKVTIKAPAKSTSIETRPTQQAKSIDLMRNQSAKMLQQRQKLKAAQTSPPQKQPPPVQRSSNTTAPPTNYYRPPPPNYPYYPPPHGMYSSTHPPPPPGYHHPHYYAHPTMPPPNGHYPPTHYNPYQQPMYGHMPPQQQRQTMPNAKPLDKRFKKIAKYRDNVFFPDGYETWSKEQHQAHIESSIHGRTKLLLFLDIDHTILHSTRDEKGKNYLNHAQFGKDIFEINFANQYNATYYVKFRPSFRKLIEELTPLYDFVLYTMGSRPYAEQVAMIIDENFRQYTKEYAQNKHNRTFIIGNRIICREDHGQIADKEYKKDVTQFAPIKTNWCTIFDDVPEVWRNRDDIHRVPKYLFWPNPDKNAPGTNHKHSDDGGSEKSANMNNNKVNIWSKNSVTSWNDDRSLMKQEQDNILVQSIEIAKAVHCCYYASYTPNNDIVSTARIFGKIRSQIMKDCHIVFTGVFPQKNAKNDFHWKLAEIFGATVSESLNERTTHLIGKGSKTSKIDQAISMQNVEIVHVNWLYQTFFNFGIADCTKFRMFIHGVDKHTPPMHCKVKVKSQRELVLMYQSK